jgi:hypothetical protein
VEALANNERLFLYLLVIACIAQSCATVPPRLVQNPCQTYVLNPLPAGRSDTAEVVIVGKVRLELPQYRIRGICRLVFSPASGLRIDFSHSSLFGAVREDATLLVRDSLVIYDRESGGLLGADSSLAVLRQSVGAPLEPADIVRALLLDVPQCSALEDLHVEEKGGSWSLRAVWQGRSIELDGRSGQGPRSWRECFPGGGRCYLVDYRYARDAAGESYPRWMRLSKEGTAEWVSFEVTSVTTAPLAPSDFEIERAASQ